MFEGKRYTTVVRQEFSTNCITWEKKEYPAKYAVYDNKTNSDVVIAGFRPTCYEDIKNKTIELNKELDNN